MSDIAAYSRGLTFSTLVAFKFLPVTRPVVPKLDDYVNEYKGMCQGLGGWLKQNKFPTLSHNLAVCIYINNLPFAYTDIKGMVEWVDAIAKAIQDQKPPASTLWGMENKDFVNKVPMPNEVSDSFRLLGAAVSDAAVEKLQAELDQQRLVQEEGVAKSTLEEVSSKDINTLDVSERYSCIVNASAAAQKMRALGKAYVLPKEWEDLCREYEGGKISVPVIDPFTGSVIPPKAQAEVTPAAPASGSKAPAAVATAAPGVPPRTTPAATAPAASATTAKAAAASGLGFFSKYGISREKLAELTAKTVDMMSTYAIEDDKKEEAVALAIQAAFYKPLGVGKLKLGAGFSNRDFKAFTGKVLDNMPSDLYSELSSSSGLVAAYGEPWPRCEARLTAAQDTVMEQQEKQKKKNEVFASKGMKRMNV